MKSAQSSKLLLKLAASMLIKHAYGEEGHKILQTTQNEAIGAPKGSAFDRLSHEGNLMTDGGKAENSALRRLAQNAEQKGGLLAKPKSLLYRGAARVADVGDALTSPFNPMNSHYHNMSTNPGDVPIANAKSQKLIQVGQQNAADQLANAAQRLDRPPTKGWAPFGGIRDKWNNFRAGQQLTDAAIQYGREGGHVLQDTVPHGTRVQQVGQGIREGVNGPLQERGMKLLDKIPDNTPLLGRMKTTAQSGLAHSTPVGLELIDSAKNIVPAEHAMVRGAGESVRQSALQRLIQSGHSAQDAERMLSAALAHTPSIPQELAGKALSQGRVLARTVPGRAVTAPVNWLRRLATKGRA